MVEILRNSVLSIIFPERCRICTGAIDNAKLGVACTSCWSETRIFDGGEMTCEKCGSYFSDVAAPKPVRCHKCDQHGYDRAIAAGIYEKAMSATVVALKATPRLPPFVDKLLSSTYDRGRFSNIDLIIPVPLSKQRKLERGFNQAEVIANSISRHTAIPVDVSSLTRIIHSPIHRVGMDAKARELTVKKAFKAMRPKLLKQKTILLVDDVLTSGATASNCAAELKKAEVEKVFVITLARAVIS